MSFRIVHWRPQKLRPNRLPNDRVFQTMRPAAPFGLHGIWGMHARLMISIIIAGRIAALREWIIVFVRGEEKKWAELEE